MPTTVKGDPLHAPVPQRLRATGRDLPALAWTSARAYSYARQWPKVNAALAVPAAPVHGVVLLAPTLLGQVAHHGGRTLLVFQPTDRRQRYTVAATAGALILVLAAAFAVSSAAAALLTVADASALAAAPPLVLLALLAIAFSSLVHGRNAPAAITREARASITGPKRRQRLITFVAAWPQRTGAGTALLTDCLTHLEPDVDLLLHASSPTVETWYAKHGFQPHGSRVMTRPAHHHPMSA